MIHSHVVGALQCPGTSEWMRVLLQAKWKLFSHPTTP